MRFPRISAVYFYADCERKIIFMRFAKINEIASQIVILSDQKTGWYQRWRTRVQDGEQKSKMAAAGSMYMVQVPPNVGFYGTNSTGYYQIWLLAQFWDPRWRT